MRCKYMVEEIQRLLDACDDLVKLDLAAFGRKMFATHDGLSKLYEVSCPEADALVDMVRNECSVLGARMMGGGFGGCTINLVAKEGIQDLINLVTPQYAARFGYEPKVYIMSLSDGTSLI